MQPSLDNETIAVVQKNTSATKVTILVTILLCTAAHPANTVLCIATSSYFYMILMVILSWTPSFSNRKILIALPFGSYATLPNWHTPSIFVS